MDFNIWIKFFYHIWLMVPPKLNPFKTAVRNALDNYFKIFWLDLEEALCNFFEDKNIRALFN